MNQTKKTEPAASAKNYSGWLFWTLFLGCIVSTGISAVLLSVYFLGLPRQVLVDKIPTQFRTVINEVRDLPFFFYTFKSSDLPMYELYISDRNLTKLSNALSSDVSEFLTSENKEKVNAIFVANNSEPKEVEVGYRGDKAYHWFFDKKSWTIRFSAEDLHNGHSEIKLIVPFDRFYIGEYFNSYRARKLDLPVPDDEMVQLSVNGESPSLYYQQAGWTEEFLENAFGTSNGNLYGEKNLEDEIFTSSFFWKKYVSIEGQESDFSDLDQLLYLVREADDEEFAEKIAGILDVDSFITWQVHSMLSGSTHQSDSHNMRLFYNNETGKFFLIPWDVGFTQYSTLFTLPTFSNDTEFYDIDYQYNPLVTRMLNIDEYRNRRNEELWDYVSNETNQTEDLAFYDSAFNQISPALYNDTKKLWRNAVAKNTILQTRSIIRENFVFLQQQLDRAALNVALMYNPKPSNTPVTLDVTHRSASAIVLKSVAATSSALGSVSSMSMYKDVNQNGELDSTDRFVAKLDQNGDTFYNNNINVILNSDRILNEAYSPVEVATTKTSFIFVTPNLQILPVENVTIQAFNSVTGTLIDPAIHVQPSRI